MGIRVFIERDIALQPVEFFAWGIEELCCFVYAWSMVALVYFGVIPLAVFVYLYWCLFGILTLNLIRTLGATHYYRGRGEPMGIQEQYADSINVTNETLVTKILCPVATNYHGLHHILPSIPYHNLRIAHERLDAALPDDSVYRWMTINSIWQGFCLVWRGGELPKVAKD